MKTIQSHSFKEPFQDGSNLIQRSPRKKQNKDRKLKAKTFLWEFLWKCYGSFHVQQQQIRKVIAQWELKRQMPTL